MKKILLLMISISFFFTETKACDICGCGVGSYYIGILPDFSKKIIGMRYRYNELVTHIGFGGVRSYLTANESYRTLEIWAGWNIGRKFRLMATIPFNFNQRENQGITSEKNGPGDISLTGYYRLINSTRNVYHKRLVQSLFVGGGIKLPVGAYSPDDKENTNGTANLFQLGTASLDFTLNAMYDLRLQDFGININAAYKINTVNKFKYDYGNKLSTNAQLYYKFRVRNKLTVAPNAGVLFENAAKDIDRKFKVDISGGNILCGSLGLETGFKKIAMGINWQKPISQNLANGSVRAKDRIMLHLAFAF